MASVAQFDAHVGVLALDLETASACDIVESGAWAYSQHPSTIVYCGVFGYATGPGSQRTYLRWRPGRIFPAVVADYLRAGGLLLAHNVSFEQSILANVLQPQLRWPTVEPDQWRDTQAMAAAQNLPRSLEGVCRALGVKHQKDMEGAALMKRLCVAEDDGNGGWTYPPATAAELQRLEDYCKGDVAATLDAYFALPKLSVTELQVWRIDQAINARGALLDQEFAGKLRRMAETRQQRLEDDVQRATLFQVEKSRASAGLRGWLRGRGIVLPKRTRKKKDGTFHKTESADKAAVAELLQLELPADVREVLQTSVEAGKAASLAKLNRVETMVGTDGRLRFALRYCGAHTGRWSSDGLQLHNLPKNKLTDVSSRLVRELCEAEDLDTLELLEARPLEAMSQMLRSVVIAPPGRELIGADFSAVEARVCAWLAGQEDVLQFFRDYDDEKRAGGKPRKFYDFTAESIGSDDYQLGKVAALALQYGMGDVTFAGQAAKAGVPLTLLQARKVKTAWRLANGCIAQWWKDLEAAAGQVVERRGGTAVAGLIVFRMVGDALVMRLPSGRCVRYWRPSFVVKRRTFHLVDDEGNLTTKTVEREELQFWKPARGTMVATTTYGGKLAENATQAVARELLAAGLLRVESFNSSFRVPPYELVIHVHDSAAAEVREGTGNPMEFSDLLAAAPPWAAGCPVAAEGWRDRRFRG